MRRCHATVRSRLRDATTVAAGGVHAANAAHREGVPVHPAADPRARRDVSDRLVGAATQQVSGVSGALNGPDEVAAKVAAKVAPAPGAPIQAGPAAGRARVIAADCAAVPDPVRRLTGPVPGALFAGKPGPAGVIRERSLS
jgi:hypothetical protein